MTARVLETMLRHVPAPVSRSELAVETDRSLATVTKVVNLLTVAVIELSVVTTSCRPPSNWALSWVKTAGTF